MQIDVLVSPALAASRPPESTVANSVVAVARRYPLRLAAYLVISGALSGCATVYYAPNSHNVPLFQAKGEWRAAAAFNGEGSFFGSNTNGGDFQAAYAITDKVGLMANGYVASKADEETGEGGRGRLFEGGVGYYGPVSERFVFETYAGAGGGTLSYVDRSGAGRASVNASRIFLQPSIGFTSKWFDAALSVRMVGLHYVGIPEHLTDGRLADAAREIAENKSSFLTEPALTLRAG